MFFRKGRARRNEDQRQAMLMLTLSAYRIATAVCNVNKTSAPSVQSDLCAVRWTFTSGLMGTSMVLGHMRMVIIGPGINHLIRPEEWFSLRPIEIEEREAEITAQIKAEMDRRNS